MLTAEHHGHKVIGNLAEIESVIRHHAIDRYVRFADGSGHIACKRCETQVEAVEVAVFIYAKTADGSPVYTRKIRDLIVPYCPKCEERPIYTMIRAFV